MCTSVSTIDKLAELDPRGLTLALQEWWKAAAHPQLLTEAANTICKEYPSASPAEVSDSLAVVVGNESSSPAGRAVAAIGMSISSF